LKRAWQITGTVYAIVFALWAQQSWQLSLTDSLGPGPGFFPFSLSLIGLALSVALVVRIGRGADLAAEPGARADMPVLPSGAALGQVLLVLGALTGVALMLETLGFRIVMALFCLIVLPALGARNWIVIALFAAAASLGVNALFSDLLKVPLPLGVFGL